MTSVDAPPAVGQESRPEHSPHTPGEAGVWVFIFGDMCVFAALFVVFLHARISDPSGFAQDQGQLNQNFGAANTILLLVSSFLVVLAVRAVRSPNVQLRSKASPLIAAAWLCGAAFLVIKAFEYGEKFQSGVTPETSEFFMYYFVLTGVHAFHLVLGLAVLTLLYALSRKAPLTQGQFAFVEGGACFWHMVDLLWLVLFPLIFLVR